MLKASLLGVSGVQLCAGKGVRLELENHSKVEKSFSLSCARLPSEVYLAVTKLTIYRLFLHNCGARHMAG